MYFPNRCVAGRRLAGELMVYRNQDPVVLALPRGGVPVAYEVAHALEAPLDVLVARKLGAPGRPELAIGAVTRSAVYYDDQTIRALDVSADYLAQEIERQTRNVIGALAGFMRDEPIDLTGKTAIVVDDGIATGATVIAAVRSIRQDGAARVVVAAPVCAPEAAQLLADEADAVVCLERPFEFGAVGFWYEDFSQTSDDEVRTLLKRARLEREARYHEI